MTRFLSMIYSVLAYFIGVAALLYLILFIADWPFVSDALVPVTVNTGFDGTQMGLSTISVLFWNSALMIIWGTQHSFMARSGFKENWIKIVPPAMERSTYVLFVAIFTALLVLLWQPLPTVIWDLSGTAVGDALVVTYVLGWLIVLYATFLINHFHLFGLQQTFARLTERELKDASFITPSLYKLVRHPMMLGVLIGLWSIPTLTVGRLLISAGLTVYIWIALRLEERTLVAELGEQYLKYQKSTPMVIPFTRP